MTLHMLETEFLNEKQDEKTNTKQRVFEKCLSEVFKQHEKQAEKHYCELP